jgi:TRAP-type transport system periplasmic protein
MMSKQIRNQARTKDIWSDRPFTRRSALKGGLALGAGLTLGAFGVIGRTSAAPVTMRFGSDSPIGAPHTKSAVVFKDLVESQTSGRVRVTIFSDAQLGDNGSMVNSVKTGSVDAVVTDISHISAAVPEADVFNLPFLYRDAEQVLRVANGPIGEQLKPKIDAAFGCEVLAWAVDGTTDLWNNKHPVRTPADIIGLKIGVGASKIQRDSILAFGGIPTSMSINAIYTSLQTGLIDGTTKNPIDVMELKIFQVTKYMTLTKHYCMPNALIVSKKVMDKLSPQDQAIVRAAGQPAVDAQVEEVVKSEAATIVALQEKGIQVYPMENPKAFADKMEVVYKEAANRIGADLVEQARKFAESS